MKTKHQSYNVVIALFFIALLTALPACSSKKQAETNEPWYTKFANNLSTADPYQEVELFYASNRASTGKTVAADYYTDKSGPLTWGSCSVTIPYDEKTGSLQKSNFTIHTFDKSPAGSYDLLDIRALPMRGMSDNIDIRFADNSEKATLVFVPGYNISFEETALLTARVTYKLQFNGATLFYSWPANGSKLDYISDEQTAKNARPQLLEFLTEVATQTDTNAIYLVGHSMGCLPLSEVFVDLKSSLDPDDMEKFKELFLITPDINRNVFTNQIMSLMAGTETKITAYGSNRDKGMKESHSQRAGVRLADVKTDLAPIKGLKFIDATAMETSIDGTKYYEKKGTVLGAISATIHKDEPCPYSK
ncbi:alpha/beta hydrolase [Maridesulfovibrio frigidus]|uniref:alpha/beta hydrolase n=1 Tax=Maridesulfovibrio frigidus TaxID=340956 RepID=UPI0004E23109|nr:alpha/beta hydrolase [Maridesulfovibrio frigidus]